MVKVSKDILGKILYLNKSAFRGASECRKSMEIIA